jgi:Protein of unknown function (DUF2569)
MQNFSLLNWMIVALLIFLVAGAVRLFARAIQNRRPRERRVTETAATTAVAGPSGFRGWLVLLAINVVLTLISTINTVVQTDYNEVVSGKDHQIDEAVIACYLALLALQSCTAFFMARRARQFVPFFIATAISQILFRWIVMLATVVVELLLHGGHFVFMVTYIVTHWETDEVIQWISTSIAFVVWIFYVLRSRRVANTFVR